MNNLEEYLHTGESLAKFLDATSHEAGNRAVAEIVMSLLDGSHSELDEEQREDLTLARMYWNASINKIPRQFARRVSERIQNDDRSGAEHSKQAWLNRLILAAFELEKEHHCNSTELVVEYALTFDIGVSTLKTTIDSHTAEHPLL